jgi:hypothetical protein
MKLKKILKSSLTGPQWLMGVGIMILMLAPASRAALRGPYTNDVTRFTFGILTKPAPLQATTPVLG